MQTRSKSICSILAVNIDFDEASKAWNSNKRKLGNGTYEYVRNTRSEKTKKATVPLHLPLHMPLHAYNTRSTMREKC
jgi:hypothetical protein